MMMIWNILCIRSRWNQNKSIINLRAKLFNLIIFYLFMNSFVAYFNLNLIQILSSSFFFFFFGSFRCSAPIVLFAIQTYITLLMLLILYFCFA